MADRVDVALLLRWAADLLREHCREWHGAFECCEADITHLRRLADAAEHMLAVETCYSRHETGGSSFPEARAAALALLRGEVAP